MAIRTVVDPAQCSLFDDTDGDAAGVCLYPKLAGQTGYRMGCRCPRCIGARRQMETEMATGICRVDGCGQYRMKHRRWCEEHAPVVKPKLRPSARSEALCDLCGRTHHWYESTLEWNCTRIEMREVYRRVCGSCRRGYVQVMRTHHLDLVWTLRLLRATHCELCGDRFLLDRDAKRRRSVVDHDHAHCPGPASCGECVRGIICTRCNNQLGAVESVVKGIGLNPMLAYINRWQCCGRGEAGVPHEGVSRGEAGDAWGAVLDVREAV